MNFFAAFEAYEAQRRRLFRNAREEEEAQLMLRPIPTRRAYALFGLLLGTLPPAAIFYRLFLHHLVDEAAVDNVQLFWLFLCLTMSAVCALTGYGMGACLGRSIDDLERKSWNVMLFASALLGALWAVGTGAAGGAVFFLIGAVFGAMFALPVGIAAFISFTVLHRLMARGGMIDARHFWPLACGVTLSIAALILNQ